jgi:hypothetical protein
MDNADQIEQYEREFQDFVSGMYKAIGYENTLFILDETLATLKLQKYSMDWLRKFSPEPQEAQR